MPLLEGRKEETEDGGSLNPRDGHLSTQTHLFPGAHPKADSALTGRQAVRHAAGAKARSMSWQLPAGDKPSSGAGLGLGCPESPPGTSPGSQEAASAKPSVFRTTWRPTPSACSIYGNGVAKSFSPYPRPPPSDAARVDRVEYAEGPFSW